jgi:hypothetical protein
MHFGFQPCKCGRWIVLALLFIVIQTSIQIKLAFKARANYIKDKPPTSIYQIFKELSAKEIVQECTAVAMGWQANYTKSLKYFEVKPCELG